MIRSVEKREAEAAAKAARVAQAEAKKRKEEEEAQIAEKDRVAREQKAEVERRTKELALKEQQAKAAKEAEERRIEEEKRAKEEKERASKRIVDKREQAGVTWRAYIEKQNWMKSEVIEKVKADRPTMTSLNKGKRMIIRWLGQALNTRESVVKIVSWIADGWPLTMIRQLTSMISLSNNFPHHLPQLRRFNSLQTSPKPMPIFSPMFPKYLSLKLSRKLLPNRHPPFLWQRL